MTLISTLVGNCKGMRRTKLLDKWTLQMRGCLLASVIRVKIYRGDGDENDVGG